MRNQDTPVWAEDSSTYLARRRRNNEAARRCRERRRMEELLLELRAMELLQENQRLRAALHALYPGPRVADWPAGSFPVQPGAPYTAWGAAPVCQPPATSAEPAPCPVLPPVRAMPGGSPDGAASAASPARTLCHLPHKLRLKGGRGLSRGAVDPTVRQRPSTSQESEWPGLASAEL